MRVWRIYHAFATDWRNADARWAGAPRARWARSRAIHGTPWAPESSFRVTGGLTPAAPGSPSAGPRPGTTVAIANLTMSSATYTCRSSLGASVRVQVAAGVVGTAVLGCAAAIEIARAWTTPPRVLAEAGHAIGGVMVALFVLSGVGLAMRSRPLAGLAVASCFALLAHGLTIVLQGQTVGAIFVGLAPFVGALVHLAFMRAPIASVPPSSARIDIAWAIAKSRQQAGRAAPRPAARSPFAMHA